MSLNLKLEVSDLPSGQLAEATITGFDPKGIPTGGTLYLDTDANGLGWYLDPTPWDNSEYSQTLTDTACRATADSLAYGHYDLLTTLLHETSHLQGFIAGYSNFNNHIQTLNGSKTFVGDGFSAILTPGVRKLPSAFDIQILKIKQLLTHPCPSQEVIERWVIEKRFCANCTDFDARANRVAVESVIQTG